MAVCSALLLALSLSSCRTNSQKYAAEMLGYSSSRGQVTYFENLASNEMMRLSDGIAIKLNQDGCRVTMEFGENMHIFEVGPGCIIVFGGREDFLLEPLIQPYEETTPSQ